MKDKILDIIENILLKLYLKLSERRKLAFINKELLKEKIMAEFHY